MASDGRAPLTCSRSSAAPACTPSPACSVNATDRRADTPFGGASGADAARAGSHGHEVLFLARHGDGHRLLPHEVNYRANIYALKRAGATQMLGFSAVGSLAERVAPGDLAVPSQYFDWTKGARERSFFGDGVAAHVSTAQPVSGNLVDWVARRGRAPRTSRCTATSPTPASKARAWARAPRATSCSRPAASWSA